MDKDGNPASADKSETSGKPKEKSSKTVTKNGARSKPNNKLKGKNAETEKGIKPEVWVAIIGAVATIVVAVLSSPLVQPKPISPTILTATSSSTAFVTDTPTRLPIDIATSLLTDTPYITDLPIFTDTPVVIATPSDPATIQPSPAPVLIARLIADKTSGRSALIVKFDARDSVLHESNGIQFSCRNGPCYYTWRVYSNGQQLGNSENNASGRFEYTFRERGTYTVTVYVCRGQDRVDCGNSGTLIVVTK